MFEIVVNEAAYDIVIMMECTMEERALPVVGTIHMTVATGT